MFCGIPGKDIRLSHIARSICDLHCHKCDGVLYSLFFRRWSTDLLHLCLWYFCGASFVFFLMVPLGNNNPSWFIPSILSLTVHQILFSGRISLSSMSEYLSAVLPVYLLQSRYLLVWLIQIFCLWISSDNLPGVQILQWSEIWCPINLSPVSMWQSYPFISPWNIPVKVFYCSGGCLFLQLCQTAPGFAKKIMEPAATVMHPSRRILTGYFSK